MKVILSSLCACCTPAVFRFSRIIWAKRLLRAVSAGFPATLGRSVRRSHPRRARDAGERLSTVNGPATRTFFLSS